MFQGVVPIFHIHVESLFRREKKALRVQEGVKALALSLICVSRD